MCRTRHASKGADSCHNIHMGLIRKGLSTLMATLLFGSVFLNDIQVSSAAPNATSKSTPKADILPYIPHEQGFWLCCCNTEALAKSLSSDDPITGCTYVWYMPEVSDPSQLGIDNNKSIYKVCSSHGQLEPAPGDARYWCEEPPKDHDLLAPLLPNLLDPPPVSSQENPDDQDGLWD